MKLLSPTEVRDVKNSLAESQAKTIVDLGARIVERTRELNLISGQIDLKRTMAEEEAEEIRIQIEALNNALGTLRTERVTLMAPIVETKEEWRAKVQEVEKEKALLEKKQDETEAERQRYVNYMEELDTRADHLEILAETMDSREAGIRRAEEVLSANTRGLDARISETTDKINTANATFAHKEMELSQREHALAVRTKALDDEQTEFWSEARSERRKNEDMRKTLERALATNT